MGIDAMMSMPRIVWIVTIIAMSLGALPALASENEADAFARVVVDSVDLRSGPGASYRSIGTLIRGDTIALDGRPSAGFWLRIRTNDGRIAYVLGSALQPFTVDSGAANAPSRPGVFAPPPLTGAIGGLAIVGGILLAPAQSGDGLRSGYIELRPSAVLNPTLSLDGFFGLAPTNDGLQFLYGGGVTMYLAPTWVICPYLTLGGGGYTVYPSADSFVITKETRYLGRAGGGILFALRNRILVRIEGSNLSLFTPDSYDNAQTITGGLGVYF